VPDSKMPEATRSIPDPLCNIARCQLYKIARIAEPDLHVIVRRLPGLQETARRGPVRQGVARNPPDIPGLREAARRKPGRRDVASDLPDIRLYNTARSEPAITKARPKPDLILPEAALYKAAKATQRVNASSPVGTEPAGQWDLYRDAVGLRTPTITV
jgi:hypothetical protein